MTTVCGYKLQMCSIFQIALMYIDVILYDREVMLCEKDVM